MNWKTLGAIVGGILLIMGGEIAKISGWHDVLTPGFVGALCVQTGGLVIAIFGAVYVPKPGETVAQFNARH